MSVELAVLVEPESPLVAESDERPVPTDAEDVVGAPQVGPGVVEPPDVDVDSVALVGPSTPESLKQLDEITRTAATEIEGLDAAMILKVGPRSSRGEERARR